MLREAAKKLSRHAFTYAAAEQLSRVVGLFLLPLFTHYLSESEYGTKELLAVTLSVLAQIAGISITAAMARHYFDGASAEHKRVVVSTTWITVAVVAGLLALSLTGASFALDGWWMFENPRMAHLFRITLAILWFQMLREVLGRYLQTEQRSLLFGTLAFAKVVTELVLQIVFVAGLRRGLEGAFEAVLISEATFAAIYSIGLLPKLGLSFSRPIFAGLIAFALPLVPNGVLQFCLHSADRYFVEWFATRNDVGIYALAYKLGYIGNYALLGPFLMVWYPYVFSLGAIDKQRRIVGELGPYFLFVLTAATLVISLFAREIVDLVAESEGYRAAASAVPWIALGYWFWGWFQIAQTGFYVIKDTRRLPWITGAAALFNALANIALIPWLGFVGAALATALTFAVLALTTQLAVRSRFPYAIQWTRTFLPLVAAVIACIAGDWLAPRIGIASWITKSIVLGGWIAWAWFGGFVQSADKNALSEIARSFGGRE